MRPNDGDKKVSIITPSYNQGEFIEETIVSVLDQGYSNLEYIIIDGGSKDKTVEIIKTYERFLTYWISENDDGQASAINKGFGLATGSIYAWLNSDDTYEPGVIPKVATIFESNPAIDVISGRCKLWYKDHRDHLLEKSPLRSYEDFLRVNTNWMSQRLIVQPEAFFRRDAFKRAGGVRESLQFCFDASLWMEMARLGCAFESVDEHWANLRIHSRQKTATLSPAYRELLNEAWRRVEEDSAGLSDPWEIARDIKNGWQKLLDQSESERDALLHSTSYQIGRMFTQLKCW